MYKRSLLLLLLLSSTVAYSAAPNLIANGSFEDDDFTDVVLYPNGFTGPNGTFIGPTYNNNTLSGWSYTQNLDGWVEGGTWAAAYDGRQYLDLIGNTNVTNGIAGITSQTINTVPGKIYSFSFYWGEDVGHDLNELVTIQADILDSNNATLFNQVFSMNAVGPIAGVRGPNTWNYFETNFVATTNQTSIEFSATAPGNGDTSAGGVIDLVVVTEVHLQPANIPTLSQWGFIVLALVLAFAGYRQYYKSQTE